MDERTARVYFNGTEHRRLWLLEEQSGWGRCNVKEMKYSRVLGRIRKTSGIFHGVLENRVTCFVTNNIQIYIYLIFLIPYK